MTRKAPKVEPGVPATGRMLVVTEFDTGSPVAGVVLFVIIMTVGTCGLEQYPLGVSLSRV